MPTKKPTTPAEQRRALQQKLDDAANPIQRQIDELDLTRLDTMLSVLQGPEVQAALAVLQTLADPDDNNALARSAGADVNALLANVIQPLVIGPEIAQAFRDRLDARLNPPAEPAAEDAPVAQ